MRPTSSWFLLLVAVQCGGGSSNDGPPPADDSGVDASDEPAPLADDAPPPIPDAAEGGAPVDVRASDVSDAPDASDAARAFSFKMAGALVLGNDPLNGTAAQLLADRFSYIGNYAVNGCQNNTAPYSCANNGCTYPGNPSAEILAYAALSAWMAQYQGAGMYVGLWGVTYDNVEAEAHCMAEVANTLRSTYGVTATFFDVDGEKSFETHQDYSQRFVTEFNKTLAFPLAKAYTPECHTAVPLAPWLTGGFTSIMPMAYWNANGVNPAYCLAWSLSYGAPKDQCQVMLDGYTHGTPHTWTDYANDIKSWGGVGFSVWRTLSGAEWDQWKPLIETKAIATY
jgi:hypothetical protein